MNYNESHWSGLYYILLHHITQLFDKQMSLSRIFFSMNNIVLWFLSD